MINPERYKVSIKKFIVFLSTANEQSENDIKEATSFMVESQRIKCLGIKLTKEVQVMYTYNYTMFLREIK